MHDRHDRHDRHAENSSICIVQISRVSHMAYELYFAQSVVCWWQGLCRRVSVVTNFGEVVREWQLLLGTVRRHTL